MCGRFAQYESVIDYLDVLDPQGELFGGYDAVPLERYNVTPSTKVKLFRSVEGGLSIDSTRWGWRPVWASRRQPMINARSETVAILKYFRPIWHHRCLIPANGWFEWTGKKSCRQPWYIHLKSNQPMFMAGIGEFDGNEEHAGFVIITSDSEGGMVDIHDRQPVVLSPENARQWVDGNTTTAIAERLLRHAIPADAFSWHKVSTKVGNVKNQGAQLIEQI